jgi:hypothetical protein
MDDPWPIGDLTPDWVPEEVDWHRPSPARVYDVHLGGAHNFAVDREVARQVAEVMPELPMLLRANRSFLRRAVRFLVRAGVTQFLDLGSGIPTVGNVHEAAQDIDPTCRVVYVDIDPVAVAHSRRILTGNPYAIAVRGDLRDTDSVLANSDVLDLLDFTRPVAVLLVAVLHFVADTEQPEQIVDRYLRAVATGSYLVLSHGTHANDRNVAQATALYSQAVEQFHLRDRDEVTRLFGDTRLLAPQVVPVALWRPDNSDDAQLGAHLPQLGGVGRKGA